MAINQDKPIGRKIPPYLEKNSATFRYDPGPYVGKVKDNRDPTRLGRLRVWIPDFGGNEDNDRNWYTVFFASPYIGTTTQRTKEGDGPKDKKFSKVQHSYGMWFPIVDLENFVVCLFIAGDPNRGIWIGGMLNQIGHHMVPAVGASDKVDKGDVEDGKVQSGMEDGEPYPVVELNEFADDFEAPGFLDKERPPHEPQIRILLDQGIDRASKTKNRGVIKSSSHREAPGTVFGISTPGRPHTPGKMPEFGDEYEQRKIKARKGGHTFVMDDGDKDEKGNLTRWRSAGGHEILLDDEEKLLYIINSQGSVYMEFTNSGSLNIYCSESINIRTKKDFNMQIDKNFNLEVKGDMKIRTLGDFHLEGSKKIVQRATEELLLFSADKLKIGSEGKMNLFTKKKLELTAKEGMKISTDDERLNIVGPGGSDVPMFKSNRAFFHGGKKGDKIEKPEDLEVFTLPETEFEDPKWQVKEGKIKSISPIVPTHEPWPREQGENSNSSNAPQDGGGGGEDSGGGGGGTGGAGGGTSGSKGKGAFGSSPPVSAPSNVAKDSNGNPILDSEGNPVLTTGASQSNDPGIKSANQTPLTNGAPPTTLKSADAPNPKEGVGPLSKEEKRGFMTQVAHSESGGDYTAENKLGYVGRYQAGAAALVDSGYISRAAYDKAGGSNKVLNDPSAWTGKDGVYSKEQFLNSPSAQENFMETNTQINYDRLVKNGGIKPGDDNGTVAGMLGTAQLLGASGAKKWRETGSGQDAFGTTGSAYFNRGKYGAEVLGRG